MSYVHQPPAWCLLAEPHFKEGTDCENAYSLAISGGNVTVSMDDQQQCCQEGNCPSSLPLTQLQSGLNDFCKEGVFRVLIFTAPPSPRGRLQKKIWFPWKPSGEGPNLPYPGFTDNLVLTCSVFLPKLKASYVYGLNSFIF